MRFGVDGTIWPHRRGVGRFARNIVRRLVELDGENSYELIVAERNIADVSDPPAAAIRTVALDHARVAPGEGRTTRDRLRLLAAVRAGRFDAFLFPMIDSVYFVGRVPTVVGVADAIATSRPERGRRGLYVDRIWPAKRRLAVRGAARVFTISEAVRDSVAAKYDLPADRVAVVPGAPDPVFQPTDGAAREPFLLCMGGLSPRKNLGTVLDAYARLRARPGGVPPLVILGPNLSGHNGVRLAELNERIERLGLAGDVTLPGYVDDQELAALYTSAAAVIVATLDEGYGLPAVEAGVCGAALVLSDVPAHRETMGDAPLVVAPGDASALADAVGRLLDDPGVAGAVRARCREQASRLSWDRGALVLRDLLVEAAGRTRRG